MKKIALIAFIALWGVSAVGQEYDWHHVEMDGTRTGTSSPSKDNVAEAVGTFKGGKYIAPNGKVFKKRSFLFYCFSTFSSLFHKKNLLIL